MTEEKLRGSSFEIMVVLSTVVITLIVVASINEPFVERNLERWIRQAGEALGLL